MNSGHYRIVVEFASIMNLNPTHGEVYSNSICDKVCQ